MFDIGAAELLVIIIVAVLVIGPKDMPLAMRTAGRWIGKVRKVSAHFRTGIDAMVREAELDDMEKKWKAQNEEIIRRSALSSETEKGEPVMTGPPPKSEADQSRSTQSETGQSEAPASQPSDQSAAGNDAPPPPPPANKAE